MIQLTAPRGGGVGRAYLQARPAAVSLTFPPAAAGAAGGVGATVTTRSSYGLSATTGITYTLPVIQVARI
ncbi:MAG: hypothetical protein NTY77_05710 [Elusimicrobia bacterium]|nr:hypothetical protein [Elusimicrobiota bacterium]